MGISSEMNSLSNFHIQPDHPSELRATHDFTTPALQDPSFETEFPESHNGNSELVSPGNRELNETMHSQMTGKSGDFAQCSTSPLNCDSSLFPKGMNDPTRILDGAGVLTNIVQNKISGTLVVSPVLFFEPEAHGSTEEIRNEWGSRPSTTNSEEPNHNDTAYLSDPDEPSLEFSMSKGRGKSAHNVIEQRYRNKINDRFAALQQTVPTLRITQRNRAGVDLQSSFKNDVAYDPPGDYCLSELRGLQPATKLNKGTILAKTVEYIKYLETKNQELLMEYHQVHLKAKMLGLEAGSSSPQCQNDLQARNQN